MEPTRPNWKDNSIGFLRLLMAAMVLVGHAPALAGLHGGPINEWKGFFGYGETAVTGFFFLSGILITRSWESVRAFWPFFVRRFLRIFPGYWACLLVCGFLLAPWAYRLEHGGLEGFNWGISNAGALGYFVKNFTLNFGQDSISGVFKGHGFNFPLWTLLSEFACYLLTAVAAMLVARRSTALQIASGVAVLGYVALYSRLPITFQFPKLGGFLFVAIVAPLVYSRDRRAWLLALTLGLLALTFWQRLPYLVGNMVDQEHMPDRLPHVVAYLLGVCCLYYEDRVPLSGTLFALAAIATIASDHFGWIGWLYMPAFCYLVYFGAFRLPFHNIERKADLSYGVYVYGYPIQQLLPLLGGAAYGYAVYLALCLAGVAIMAAASWFIIEKPAMKLRRYFEKPKPA